MARKSLSQQDLTGNKIVNVGNPTSNQDAATKSYVDGEIDNTVQLTGDQTIAGNKTFTGMILGDYGGDSGKIGFAGVPTQGAAITVYVDALDDLDKPSVAMNATLGVLFGDGTAQPDLVLGRMGAGQLYTTGSFSASGLSITGEYTLPSTDGTSGQVLTTDGSGDVTWETPSGSGTVTSVGMTVPTGLTISGSPVTTSGTLALTYDTGYQGYTATEASKLSGIASGAEVNVQSDWSAGSGDAHILNKPTLGSLAALNDLSSFDTDDLAEGSTNLYSKWATATRNTVPLIEPISSNALHIGPMTDFSPYGTNFGGSTAWFSTQSDSGFFTNIVSGDPAGLNMGQAFLVFRSRGGVDAPTAVQAGDGIITIAGLCFDSDGVIANNANGQVLWAPLQTKAGTPTSGDVPQIAHLGVGVGGVGTIQYNSAKQIGFFEATPISKPTVSGARVGNIPGLENTLSTLASLGLITNSTSAGNYTLPTADGTNGQALTTNGTGTVSWTSVGNVTTTGTQTLTNKRIQPRVSSAASGDISPAVSTADIYIRTGLTANATINAPTGTPVQGEKLTFRIKDNGTSRTLTWNAIYKETSTATLPIGTIPGSTYYISAIYNAADTSWDVLAVSLKS